MHQWPGDVFGVPCPPRCSAVGRPGGARDLRGDGGRLCASGFSRLSTGVWSTVGGAVACGQCLGDHLHRGDRRFKSVELGPLGDPSEVGHLYRLGRFGVDHRGFWILPVSASADGDACIGACWEFVVVVLSASIGRDPSGNWRGLLLNPNELAPLAALGLLVGLPALLGARGRGRVLPASLGVMGVVCVGG